MDRLDLHHRLRRTLASVVAGEFTKRAFGHDVALMQDALIQEHQNDQPDLDLIPKLVTGLLAHRTSGRWLNTQEPKLTVRSEAFSEGEEGAGRYDIVHAVAPQKRSDPCAQIKPKS